MDMTSPLARIDIHTHILPSSLSANAQKYLELRPHAEGDPRLDMFHNGKFFRTIEPNCFDINVRLREMDENKTDMQVLSTIPVLFNYSSKDAEGVLAISRELNDHIASICRQHPTRFIGLGTVPLQAPELAINELRRCVNELGLKGVQIGTHVNQWNLDCAELDQFWYEVEKLDACVFVHPWDMPKGERFDDYWMPWLCGMPFETTSAICSILMGGVLEKYPKLRLAFAHGGGSFPFTVGRIDHGHECRPDLCAYKNSKLPSSYIGRFCVDSLVHDSRALKYLVETMNEDCIMLGSDCPFPLGENRDVAVEFLKRTIFHPGKTKCEEQKREASEKYEERCEPSVNKLTGSRYCPDIKTWGAFKNYEVGSGLGR
ncbi:unnamed protein product [Rotaria socialis]|uniref:2-amino-3-carboxymuconate-6-semialdehyde decarboxylase n=1 Tax=Rotaria socialis TaxID=392032 RepID=A0A820HM29_9BILA|nr:unnamed protein product [Rotaria socialis]CAF4298267.1 unnamed protein product [Rotaria socialis]CAF4705981.1 unnamed protein product [Rotaria socialis]